MDALTYTRFGFTYAGADAPALEDADWAVPQGAFALLVGNTGSGKTTFLRCAKPEIAPAGARAGAVRAFGEEVAAGGRAPHVGYVFQSPDNQIVCDTVWHELAFGLENEGLDQDTMRRRVAEVAHFFGMEPWFRREVSTLSGGQKQLLNLAAVLALRPRLLLLDEPTAQLDPVAQRSFLHALFRVNRELGITVVVATHSPEAMADYATCAARVEGGRVLPCALDDLRIREGEAHAWGAEGEGAEALALEQGPAGPRATRSAFVDSFRRAPRSFPEPAPATPLALEGAFFRYARNAAWVLRNMDLDLSRPGVHAIVGGNGCGKSTVLRVLAGVLAPERGRVRNALRREQALLPQDPQALLVCDTVRDELGEWAHGAGYGSAEIDAAMARMGIGELADRHPFDVSGGQQQKVALAKLMLTRPRLLLLDEPVKGLDAPSKCEVARALLELRAEGCQVVLVTHDLAFASRVADDMTMLFDGEVACSQPARAFCRENLFYRPQPDQFTQLWDEEEANRAGQAGAAAPYIAQPGSAPDPAAKGPRA
ncbi:MULTISPECIES: ABC transporter ATP-binding protein [unclassified Adlercreutzia]|uniref:ABC transporter ATP-binding protein n=1 Tax=unclassified Adlercreutzia TaxID=2636013 RepID=UPI0013ED5A46|nr:MULTISPECIES: ATP-binding cassette domain-containing protein [unclassified Adlercreutzia]